MSKIIEKVLSDGNSLEEALANLIAAYQRQPSPQSARAIALIRAKLGKSAPGRDRQAAGGHRPRLVANGFAAAAQKRAAPLDLLQKEGKPTRESSGP